MTSSFRADCGICISAASDRMQILAAHAARAPDHSRRPRWLLKDDVPMLQSLAAGFTDLIFAPVCIGCGGLIPTAAADRQVCGACWSRLRPIPLPRCARCAMPQRPSISASLAPEGCSTCDSLPPAVRSLRSAYVLEGPAHRMVHGLKYGGWHCLAESMGSRMARVPLGQEAEEEVAAVVPVPLSDVRMRQRGYNQAALLAAVVARFRRVEARPNLLRRSRATESQTTLHPSERRANVAGAFRVPAESAASVRRQHLLIVDDVWTTGATTLACAEALLLAGARAVSVLTFARALPELRR